MRTVRVTNDRVLLANGLVRVRSSLFFFLVEARTPSLDKHRQHCFVCCHVSLSSTSLTLFIHFYS